MINSNSFKDYQYHSQNYYLPNGTESNSANDTINF